MRNTAFVVPLGLTALLCCSPSASGAVQHWRASYSSPVPPPKDRAGTLTDLVALSSRDVLAAGFAENSDGGPFYPVIKDWNGSKWSTWRHQPKKSATTGVIDTIAATSLSNVWVVVTGNRVNDHYTRRIQHWDGHSWHSVTLAGLPQSWFGRLVLIRHRPWLLGGGATSALGTRSAFIASYGKVRGKPHWTTRTYSRSGELLGGSVRSKRDAWAVGGTVDPDSGGVDGVAVAEHWNGHRWHRTPVPRPASTLASVAAAGPHNALAVGNAQRSHSRVPVAYIWRGKAWRSIGAPADATQLNAVTVDPGGGYWAAGVSASDHTHTVYYRYVGGRWHTVQGPQRSLAGTEPQQFATINAMATVGGQAWAVGYLAAHDCDDEDDCIDNAGQLIVDRW